MPQDLGNEQPDRGRGYRAARTAPGPLAEGLGGAEVIVFVFRVEVGVVGG